MTALRGVNLGGWLVLERWMTPTLFAGTDANDEYTWMQAPGAIKALASHRKNFIQEADFEWMASHSIDVIRIPVGYWVLDGDRPYAGAISYVDWAMKMAKKYHLKVLLCLHGAPGSQNGHDHSGRVGRAAWFDDISYRERTIEILARLARRYKSHPALWGLELLNEPLTRLFQKKLRTFYKEAQDALEAALPASVHIIFHDAFTPRLLNGAISSRKNRVVMDVHWYHFTYWAFRWTPLEWYFRLILPLHRRLIRRLNRRQPVIIGEWNGIIAGEVLNTYPQTQHMEMCREHIRRQCIAYGEAAAWFYWTYKTEDPGIWNYRSLVDDDPTTFE